MVPVKDRRERMLACLDALLALDHPSYEVVVLDNESTDGTAEACRERAARASVDVRVEVMGGSVGRLRNRGAELARAELVAYTDSDCAPEPGWLRAAERPFEAARVGVVQGTTLPEEGKDLPPWSSTIEVREFSHRYESCNLVVRREALLASDGFDEVVGHFWEDTAAGAALARAGWHAAFAPDAVVRHDVTYPGTAWWLRRALRYGNAARVVGRYPELRSTLLWARIFVRPRSAMATAAALGLLLLPFSQRAILLLLPYLWERRPPKNDPRAVLFDAVVLAGMISGSVRHRSLVL